MRVALWCYPGWWRERYSVDARSAAADLLGEGHSQLTVAASYGIGALRAHFGRPDQALLGVDPECRLRASVSGMLPGWLLFVVLSVVVAKGVRTEWVALPPTIVAAGHPILATVPWVRGAQSVAGYAIAVVLVLCAAAYVSTAVRLCRSAIRRQDRGTVVRLLGPLLVVMVIVVLVVVQVWLDGSGGVSLQKLVSAFGLTKIAGILLFQLNQPVELLVLLEPVGLWIGIVVVVAATARWFDVALRRSADLAISLRLHAALGTTAVCAMVVAWIALAVRTVAMAVERPQFFGGVSDDVGVGLVSVLVGLAALLLAVAWCLGRSFEGLAAWRGSGEDAGPREPKR